MKPQDILFLLVLLPLLYKRDPMWFALAGIFCLVLSAPLFSQWIFFTAQRLVIYAFLFFLLSLLLHIKNLH